MLKANPTDWLLERDNPSVRYFTLKDILGKAENDPEVKQARQRNNDLRHCAAYPGETER